MISDYFANLSSSPLVVRVYESAVEHSLQPALNDLAQERNEYNKLKGSHSPFSLHELVRSSEAKSSQQLLVSGDSVLKYI